LRGEYGGYTNARDRAIDALQRAGGEPEVSAADHASIVERHGALLISEIGRAKELKEKQNLAQRFRDLADQIEDPRFDLAREAGSAQDHIVAIELLLLELREERRRYIEGIRQALDITTSPGLIQECCALLEEDVASSLAAGDAEGAHRSTASLASVRAMMRQAVEEIVSEGENLKELAHYLAASVISDRSNEIVAGDALSC
jgi:hypothetical protein